MPGGQRAAVARRRGTVGAGTSPALPADRRSPPARVARAALGTAADMVPRLLHTAGGRSAPMHGLSLGSIALCLMLWIRAKTVDQDERHNAERRAIFVGLWPPMFWLIGDAVARCERRGRLGRGRAALR